MLRATFGIYGWGGCHSGRVVISLLKEVVNKYLSLFTSCLFYNYKCTDKFMVKILYFIVIACKYYFSRTEIFRGILSVLP